MDFGAVPAAAPAAAAGTAAAAAVAAPKPASQPAAPKPADRPAAAAPVKPLAFHSADSTPPSPAVTPAADLGKPSEPATEANVRTLSTPAPAAPSAPAAPEQRPSAAPLVAGHDGAAVAPAPEVAAPGTTGPASSAPNGPVEITCREERLDITTEWHVLGTAKLRKYVTSEAVERRVPVVRERVRVERMPVGEAERASLSDKDIAEAVEEVTLREERPVVRKYLAPIERVRLVVERYTAEEVIRDELRREHVEVHDNTAAASTPAPSSAHSPAASPTASHSGTGSGTDEHARAGEGLGGPSGLGGHPGADGHAGAGDPSRPAPLRPLA
ncbi:YsnF/AvaK domain-containing protein [Kitasatospora sp. NPDC003701]